MASINALVTPEVLKWSRSLDRIQIYEIAHQMKVTTEKILAWEDGSASPTMKQAKDLAKKYRVPFAYFYLPDEPKKIKRISVLYRYRDEYARYKERNKKDGFLPPAMQIGTQVGKLYARTVLSAYNQDHISPKETSGYLLNLRIQHFSKVERWCF